MPIEAAVERAAPYIPAGARLPHLATVLCFAWVAATLPAAAAPPPAFVHKPVAAGQRGGHPGTLGGPAKRHVGVGGPAPHG
jgi:hypothetical protein